MVGNKLGLSGQQCDRLVTTFELLESYIRYRPRNRIAKRLTVMNAANNSSHVMSTWDAALMGVVGGYAKYKYFPLSICTGVQSGGHLG